MSSSKDIIVDILEGKASRESEMKAILQYMEGYNDHRSYYSFLRGYDVKVTGDYRMTHVEEMGRGLECDLEGHFVLSSLVVNFPYEELESHIEDFVWRMLNTQTERLAKDKMLRKVPALIGDTLDLQAKSRHTIDFHQEPSLGVYAASLHFSFPMLAAYRRITNK